MLRFLLVGAFSGILFGVMDGVINGNLFARRLFEVYEPIARRSINVPAGVVIDLLNGFVLAAIFLLLHKSLPGSSRLIKGFSFGLLVWFLRVVMNVATTWMMFRVPALALVYVLITGLAEMLILGFFYGIFLTPVAKRTT
jgi:hypothetical protein